MTTTERPLSPAARSYVDRLADLLPAREARRVRGDVEGLISDHAEALLESRPELAAEAAEAEALKALGTPEALAERLVDRPIRIPWASWRLGQRLLMLVIPCHLLLACLVTAAGGGEPVLHGLLGPLPTQPWTATVVAALALVLMDIGAVVLITTLLGRRANRALASVDDTPRWTHRDALQGLVLWALLAVILNVLLRRIFTVEMARGEAATFLTQTALDLVPWANVVLGLFVIRDVCTLAGRSRHRLRVGLDLLASIGAAALFAYAATRDALVHFPAEHMGEGTARILTTLTTRLFLLLLILGALGWVVRAVKLMWRLPRLAH